MLPDSKATPGRKHLFLESRTVEEATVSAEGVVREEEVEEDLRLVLQNRLPQVLEDLRHQVQDSRPRQVLMGIHVEDAVLQVGQQGMKEQRMDLRKEACEVDRHLEACVVENHLKTSCDDAVHLILLLYDMLAC